MLVSCLVVAAWGFKRIPLRVVFVFCFRALSVNSWFALDTAHATSIVMLTSKLISFRWNSLGTSLRAWNVSSYLFRRCLPIQSLPVLPAGSQRPFQHCSFRESVDLRWFAQISYERGSLSQICAHAFLGSLPHKDIGMRKVMRARVAQNWLIWMGDEAISIHRCQKGLSAVHSEKSAANICNLRQRQQSCFAYMVLDDSNWCCNRSRETSDVPYSTPGSVWRAPLAKVSAIPFDSQGWKSKLTASSFEASLSQSKFQLSSPNPTEPPSN